MANTHTKLSARVEDPQYKVRQRNNVGGKLHRHGEGRKREASPTVAQAIVVHVEKAETALEAEIVTVLRILNARFKHIRAWKATAELAAAAQAREDICNIIRVPTSAQRNAQIAQAIATYN